MPGDSLKSRLEQLRIQQANDTAASQRRESHQTEEARRATANTRAQVLPLIREFMAALRSEGIPPIPIYRHESEQFGFSMSMRSLHQYYRTGSEGWLLGESTSTGTYEEPDWQSWPALGLSTSGIVFEAQLKDNITPEMSFFERLSFKFGKPSLVPNREWPTQGVYTDPRLANRDHYAKMLGWHLSNKQ